MIRSDMSSIIQKGRSQMCSQKGMSRRITKMLSEEAGLVGMIFRELDCKGKEYGKCPEHKGCGKFE